MIVWISGAYGVGKSTLVEAMAARMENALVFDAEEVGNAVRGNYPNCPYGYIFEDYPLWGEFCCLLLKDIHDRILQRGEEEGCWCMAHIGLAREGSAALPGLHIATDGVPVEALADRVLGELGIRNLSIH